MKAVISNFSTFKTLKIIKTLPVLLFFLTCCTVYTPSNSSNTAISGDKIRDNIVLLSNSLIDNNYKYGGMNPSQGFDCSGFTYYVYKKNNIRLPHSSKLQSKIGRKIKIKNAKPGDLIFFKAHGRINHVGIVTSNNRNHLFVVHSTTSAGVKKDDVLNSKYWKKRITFVKDVISH